MNNAFTFGVELEMAVAVVLPGNTHPNPSETLTVVFSHSEHKANVKNGRKQKSKPVTNVAFYTTTVQADFRRLLTEASFVVSGTNFDTPDR